MKYIILSTLLLLCIPMHAEQPAEVDSTMQAQYIRCRDNLRKPEIVAMCDTLYQLAVQQNDLQMQGTAMILTVDYYYSENDLDSLNAWMERIGRFATEHNQPKPYYFAWNKLVNWYIKNAKYTSAQYEIEKLIRQAEHDNYKSGVATAYYSLGNIYLLRGTPSSAAAHYQKAVNYILENDLERYTLTNIYSQMATAYTTLGKYSEALIELNNAEKYTSTPGLKYLIDGDRAKVYAKSGNRAKALSLLLSIESNRPPYFPDKQLYELRMSVYISCNMYPQALDALNALIEANHQSGDQEIYYCDVIENRAIIHAAMGNMQLAYKDLSHFVKLFKSKASKEGESTLAEFATLMNVEQLNQETNTLKQEAQQERLRRTHMMLTALIIILTLATLFIIILLRQNRKLHRAKSAAEQASRMKGEFIRNITHEVNTPLNALLGFTELAIITPTDDPDRQGYIDIVHENSDLLQKLIDDTLYIADLESSNEALTYESTDLYACCRHSLNNVAHLHKTGVAMLFHPEQDSLKACIPTQYVIKTITELLRNALAFTSQGTITLTAERSSDGEEFQITVTDTGCGIPTTESEHIFGRFVKLNSFTQGMGIGLSVCQMIALRMHATLRHDPTYTSGACFIFTFKGQKVDL